MVEKEYDGQLPFLGIILLSHNDDGSISISVYHKDTHTDQYLFTHTTQQHKKAVVKALMCGTKVNSLIIESKSFTGKEAC